MHDSDINPVGGVFREAKSISSRVAGEKNAEMSQLFQLLTRNRSHGTCL